MHKEIKKILLVLILYSFATGLFGNFEEFWMQGTGLSLKSISIVLSIASLISCSVIFLCTNWITPARLKRFACTLIFTNCLVDFVLFLLYKTTFLIPLKFFVIMDYALSVEIIAVIYPLMSQIHKSDRLYAIKELLYVGFFYFSFIVGIFLLKKALFNITISYNSYLIISSLLMFIAGVLLTTVKVEIKENKLENLLNKVIAKIKRDSISKNYLAFSFFGTLAYNVITGVLILILVKSLNYSESSASAIRLILGISSPIIGAIILAKFTFKNNYINIGIKYLARSIIYLLPIIYLSNITILIAIIYTEITSACYINVIDAPYINRFNSKEQLSFSNLKDILGYLAKAIGTFLCGFCMIKNIKLNFLVAMILFVISVFFAYKALCMYNKEKSGGNYDRQ